ncbi:asparaginase [Rhizobiaceae bacterium]|nr:asparaginase [Rhizobiaceae bacterium]
MPISDLGPVLVEITRGDSVESVHRGAISVIDGDGATVLAIGNVDTPVFPRSAVKAIQALPLIESGAADAYGFTDADLALACSSHSGEPRHVDRATALLAKAGLTGDALECGGHWSIEQGALIEQARAYGSTPPAICNNCSGKHSGFLCTAVHAGVDTHGYIRADHPIQVAVKDALEAITGAAHLEDACGPDGCSIPTYAIPLSAAAHGFARMTSGSGLGPERAKAARRLLTACMNEPFYMAGSNRFCTQLMTLGAGRLFAKVGAEGVYCAAIPELGLGIALKAADGSQRAAESLMAATFARLLRADDPLHPELAALADKPMHNWNDIQVGRIRSVLPA